MWALLTRRLQVLILVGVSICFAWGLDALVSFFSEGSASPLKFVSLVGFLISAVLVPVAGQLWRPLWRRFPALGTTIFPDLNGEWDGVLKSTWVNPSTGETPGPIPIKVWIRQGLFTTTVKLSTKESTSFSTRCLLEADPDAGRFRIWYSYDNEPKAEVRYRSSNHEGVAWLECDALRANELVGFYYTARKTSGDITLLRDAAKSDPSAPAV